MKNIQLLDCTLRDGGHINHSEFGEDVIKSIIRDLASSGMDVIETGFLQNCEYDPDRAMYNTIEEAKRVLPKARPAHVKYALMAQADLYDFSKLEDNDGTFEIIRITGPMAAAIAATFTIISFVFGLSLSHHLENFDT